jgi:hypothetical protein
VLCVSLFSCAGQLLPEATPEAKKLKVVENADNCRIIDVVIGSSEVGTELGQYLELAMIDARNKAARLGADSIRILGSEDVSARTPLAIPTDSVMLEALDCDLNN